MVEEQGRCIGAVHHYESWLEYPPILGNTVLMAAFIGVVQIIRNSVANDA
jgi:hypothetical protein